MPKMFLDSPAYKASGRLGQNRLSNTKWLPWRSEISVAGTISAGPKSGHEKKEREVEPCSTSLQKRCSVLGDHDNYGVAVRHPGISRLDRAHAADFIFQVGDFESVDFNGALFAGHLNAPSVLQVGEPLKFGVPDHNRDRT